MRKQWQILKLLPSALALGVLFHIATNSKLVVAAALSDSADEGFAKLVAWMKEHGGRVDPKHIDVTVMNGIRGVVALTDIEDGTELLFCPWNLIIGSTGLQDQMQAGDGMCKVVQEMADEIRLGTDSLWYPYLDYIELPRLAAVWDQSALDEFQGLSPSQDATRHLQWFKQSCDGSLDQPTMRSLVSFVSRASGVGMIPIYDLFNHHNGKRNVKLSLTEEGVQLLVVGGPILRGEEIYLSYGVKAAPTMFRDYGFVEEWPAFWNFKDMGSGDNFAFVLFPDDVVAINPTPDFLKQMWQSNMPLSEYQSSAKLHMESIPLEELRRFSQATRNYLNGLPTTLEEDAAILEVKRKLLAQTSAPANASNIEDTISAINYRRTFKEALATALIASEAAAQTVRASDSHQDL